VSWVQWLRPGAAPNEEHERLISLLAVCHQSATISNNNASSAALGLAASSGASLWQSVAAGLLTFGDKHGPVTGAREVLYRVSDEELAERVEDKEYIPGWGNAFFKHGIDPSWPRMDHLIRSDYPDHYEKVERVGKAILKGRGVVLYPNASTYTAVVCELIGIDIGAEPVIALACRLPAWGSQYLSAKQ
jgi:citrate synthase